MKQSTITYKQAVKEIFIFSCGSVPLLFSGQSISFCNSSITAHLGTNERSAATLIDSIQGLASWGLNAPLYIVSAKISELNNNNDRYKIGKIAHASYLLAICCSLPQIAIFSFVEKSLIIFGQDKLIAEIIGKYFRYYVISVPFLSLQSVTDQILLATNHKYIPVLSLIFGGCASVFFSYYFSFMEKGKTNLGLNGIALSSSIRVLITTSLCIICFKKLAIKDEQFSKYNLFKFNKDGLFSILKKLFNLGLPLLLMFSSEAVMVFVVNLLIGRLGKKELSAQLVVSQWQNILSILDVGIGIATQIKVAQALTTNYNDVIIYGRVGLAFATICPILYLCVSVFDGRILIEPFLNSGKDDSDIIAILEQQKLLFISGISNILLSLRLTSTQALICTETIDGALIFNMLTVWLGVGAAAILRPTFGIIGINMCLCAGYFFGAVGQLINFYYKAKKFRNTSENNALENESKRLIDNNNQSLFFSEQSLSITDDVEENIADLEESLTYFKIRLI